MREMCALRLYVIECACVQQHQQQQHTFQPVYALFHLSLANSFRIQFTVKRHTTSFSFRSSLVEVVSKCAHMHVLVYNVLFVYFYVEMCFSALPVNFSCRRRNRRKRIKEGEKERKREKCVCWRKNLPLSIIHSCIAVLKISLRNEYFMYAKSALQFFIVFFLTLVFVLSFFMTVFSVFSFSHRIEITLNCILSPWHLSLSTQCYLNVHL